MILEVMADLCRRGGIGRIPNQRLAQAYLRPGILGMRLENTDAFGSRFGVIGKQNSKCDDKSLIGRVASCEGSHPCDCRGLTCGCCVKGLVVSHCDPPVRGMIAIPLPIDSHGIVGFPLRG